jgi:Fic-DOC domain mobile mystery protein B
MMRAMTPKNETFATDDGNTPLDEDAIAGLIPPDVHTRAELNAWEATNIGHAIAWAYGRAHVDILSVETLQEIHRRMFDATWSWAGKFRRSENSISPYQWAHVPAMMRELIEDTRVQYVPGAHGRSVLDDIALHFHHRLVLIHPWTNGNGRHARLATDLLLREWNCPAFTWGDTVGAGFGDAVRRHYIEALRAADASDFDALRRFVRS